MVASEANYLCSRSCSARLFNPSTSEGILKLKASTVSPIAAPSPAASLIKEFKLDSLSANLSLNLGNL